MVDKIQQPETMAPDSAIDPTSPLPAGVGAPDDFLDAQLEKLDSSEDKVGLPFDIAEKHFDAHQEEDPTKELSEEPLIEPEEEPEPEPEQEEQAKDDEEEPVKKESADRGELQKAVTALKRDGLPSDVIEKMTNAEVIELGQKRAKVQGDTDNAYRELSELKKQQEKAPESETKSAAHAEPTDQPVTADLHKAIKPFADIFGDDAAEALRDYGTSAIKPLVNQINAQAAMLEAMLQKTAKTQLTDRFPQLADDEAYARVSERMQSLAKTGEYSDFNSLMTDASRIEFSDESNKASEEIDNRRNRQKAAGQMTSAGGSETPSHSLSEEEREEALLNALEEGMPTREARQLFGNAEKL